LKSSFQSWSSTTIAVIIVGVKRRRNSEGEKQLLIIDWEGEFDQNVIVLGNNFKIEYEQFFKVYYEGQCVMVLIKKYGNNIQRILIFESTIVHNFHKGCWWRYLNLSFQVAQQTINCLTCTKRGKFLFIFFKNILKVFSMSRKKKFNNAKCSFIGHLY